jgi:hypothetical protein
MRVMEVLILAYEDIQDKTYLVYPPLLGIQIRMFLSLPDPDPFHHQAKIVPVRTSFLLFLTS